VALEVAEALKAEKLIFLTGGGELPMNGKKPAQLSVEEAAEWLKKKKADLSGEMASKLEHGLRACREGVSRAHILNGLEDDALLEELFSSEGVGTMIYADEYTEIRKALKKDVRSIMRLIGSSVASEELVRRTRGEVAAAIGDYSVFEIDGNMVGCVAVQGLEGKTAEMGCLFVASGHENAGIGRKLMLYAENRAKEMGMKRLLALSTQAFNYLQSKGGFSEGTVDVLPAARKASYEASGRNSKILYKELV
jgi:amino-acid N-acetyltransferase